MPVEAFLGEIVMIPYGLPGKGRTQIPEGWHLCDGTLLPVSGNEALFAVIGKTYGGDGVSNFALPNLQCRMAPGMGNSPTAGTTFILGQTGGAETVALQESEIPAHSHTMACSTAAGTTGSPGGNLLATAPAGPPIVGLYLASSSAPNKEMNTQAIQPTGSSVPHENMSPFLTICFIICTVGVFPTRP